MLLDYGPRVRFPGVRIQANASSGKPLWGRGAGGQAVAKVVGESEQNSPVRRAWV